jgi:hypothetical protein
MQQWSVSGVRKLRDNFKPGFAFQQGPGFKEEPEKSTHDQMISISESQVEFNSQREKLRL